MKKFGKCDDLNKVKRNVCNKLQKEYGLGDRSLQIVSDGIDMILQEWLGISLADKIDESKIDSKRKGKKI
jgi:hypothetical protein